jgi:hypothetical protein
LRRGRAASASPSLGHTLTRPCAPALSRLAYFFTEHADATAFLRAVSANAPSDLNAQIIGVSFADIIKAYMGPEAKRARETFVLIPTMAEVAAARQLMRSAGAPATADELGPGSGLVPVFWSEKIAVQSAGGKQRKVLFFRVRASARIPREREARRLCDKATHPRPIVRHVAPGARTVHGALLHAHVRACLARASNVPRAGCP